MQQSCCAQSSDICAPASFLKSPPKARQLTVTFWERMLSLGSDNLPAACKQPLPGEPLPNSKHFAAEMGWFMLVSHSFKKC